MDDILKYYEVFGGITPADIFFAEIAPIATIPATVNLFRRPVRKTDIDNATSRHSIRIFGDVELDIQKECPFCTIAA